MGMRELSKLLITILLSGIRNSELQNQYGREKFEERLESA